MKFLIDELYMGWIHFLFFLGKRSLTTDVQMYPLTSLPVRSLRLRSVRYLRMMINIRSEILCLSIKLRMCL